MSARSTEFVPGRLLAAAHSLIDPNFAQSVIAIVEHDHQAAFGLVLNRPTDVLVADLMPPWGRVSAAPAFVYQGGPVEADETLLALGRTGLGLAEIHEVVPGIATLDINSFPSEVTEEAVRVFAGYAGWGPGQLEREISTGSWYVLDAAADDLLSADPAGLWATVMRRRGGLFRTVPEDPGLN